MKIGYNPSECPEYGIFNSSVMKEIREISAEEADAKINSDK